MGVEVDDITLSELTTTVTGASVEHEMTTYWRHRHYMRWSWDTASVIRLPWWPELLQEWKTRERRWPDMQTIESLTEEVFLIGKPSDSNDENSTEFRYSFSHIEPKLIEPRSRQQGFVYLVFKIMFYQHLKPLDCERTQSYFAKNVMLWVCEQHPPNDEIWVSDDVTTLLALKLLFAKMLAYFIDGFMPYYFIPSINVISKVDNDLKGKVIQTIQDILSEGLESYLPSTEDVDGITRISERNAKDFQKLHDLLEMGLKKQYVKLICKYCRYWKEITNLFFKVGLHD